MSNIYKNVAKAQLEDNSKDLVPSYTVYNGKRRGVKVWAFVTVVKAEAERELANRLAGKAPKINR